MTRALSKLGVCSRTQAEDWIGSGRVRVNGAVRREARARVDPDRDRIEVDGRPAAPPEKVYLMLNKPRGIVTTRSDERGRETVYECLKNADLPWIAPVGRLDQASEGLLLLTNDTRWAAGILSPESRLEKTYHVQIDTPADARLLEKMRRGARAEEGEFLRAKRVKLLRRGNRNSWLEVILDEGKNRQIRRLLSALGVHVLRLIRIAIGSLELGNLKKGAFRLLTRQERDSLRVQNFRAHRKEKEIWP